MSDEGNIEFIVQSVEDHVEVMYRLNFTEAPKPPPIDLFKASAIAEISRRLKDRATKIEEDWNHFTR